MTRHDDQPEDKKVARRTLLDLVLAAGGALWALGMAVPAALYLWPARTAGPASSVVEAGPPGEIPENGSKMLHARGKPIILIRIGAEEFRAFSAICTHLGCIVHWDEVKKQIICPCHAGVFAADGTVVSGPPPAPLAEFRVMVIGGRVRVETG